MKYVDALRTFWWLFLKQGAKWCSTKCHPHCCFFNAFSREWTEPEGWLAGWLSFRDDVVHFCNIILVWRGKLFVHKSQMKVILFSQPNTSITSPCPLAIGDFGVYVVPRQHNGETISSTSPLLRTTSSQYSLLRSFRIAGYYIISIWLMFTQGYSLNEYFWIRSKDRWKLFTCPSKIEENRIHWSSSPAPLYLKRRRIEVHLKGFVKLHGLRKLGLPLKWSGR